MSKILLDEDGEALIRETQFDIAVPIHAEELCGETKIFAYPSVAPLCEAWQNRYADDLFSPDAVAFLKDGCADFCAAFGYRADRHSAVVGYNFLSGDAVNTGFTPCERIRREGKYENKTTFDLAACLAAERVMFAVVRDGAIVSLAVTCEAPSARADAGGMMEISVETAPAYRGNGYATASVAALADWLSARGFTTLYKCRAENEKSARVAARAGLTQSGRFMYFVFRKDRS